VAKAGLRQLPWPLIPCESADFRLGWCEGDHTSEKYKADIETCRTSSTETVRLKNAATPGRWIISPITGPPAVRAAIRTCMGGKGYVLQKTDD
jgi:hypothetical protein